MLNLDQFLLSYDFPLDLEREEVPESLIGENQSESDVVAVIARLMIERQALGEEVEKLKTEAPKDDNFGRFAKQALHFLDGLDRIVSLGRKEAPDEVMENWIQSVEAVNERALRTFERFGLIPMECIGLEVDLARHEVIEYRKTGEYPHDSIIEVIQRGFEYQGKVLRDAKVVVACNPSR